MELWQDLVKKQIAATSERMKPKLPIQELNFEILILQNTLRREMLETGAIDDSLLKFFHSSKTRETFARRSDFVLVAALSDWRVEGIDLAGPRRLRLDCVEPASGRRLIRNKRSTENENSPRNEPKGRIFSMNSNYLVSRETGFFREMTSYKILTQVLDRFPPIQRKRENSALHELRKRHTYGEIAQAIQWLVENGTFPDRQRCLFPFAWLSTRPARLRDVLHRASAERIREQLEAWRRELVSERERERIRAKRAEDTAFQKFCREYPTLPERNRAMIRVFNLHREKFGWAELADPAARALCVALLVSEIEALEIVQERRSQAG